MARVIAFNTNNILSVTTAWKVVSAVVILFVLQCVGAKDVYIFAQTTENEPDRVKVEPEVISETVEPVVESWGDTKGFGEKIDWIHSCLYKIAQNRLERFDYWFKPPPGEQPIIVKPPRFRVGIFGEAKIKEYEQFDARQVVDFDMDIELPNVKRQIKLIITTNDPTTLPGKYITEQLDKSLRAAVEGKWRHDASAAIGVRVRWKPELFANAVWSPTWKRGNCFFYAQQKFYWENESGIGEISTLVFDHWINRWNTRFSTSIKWSEQDRDDDHRIERKDVGFRWSEVFVFNHAKELLDETQVGRLVSGYDVARGWGIRLAAFGGFHLVDEYRAGIFYRCPLRKKWMYLLVEPEINWRNENNWNSEWKIKLGIEMLFWGKKER
jgi:hypothetical protein